MTPYVNNLGYQLEGKNYFSHMSSGAANTAKSKMPWKADM
jgi:hypothetical protein